MQRILATASAIALAPIIALAATPQGQAAQNVDISLKAGSGTYIAKGQGSCTHAPRASIYGVLSQMWMVRHQEQGRSFQMTFWKPADGSEPMFSLSLNGKPQASVSTVRDRASAGAAQKSDSGTASLASSGPGGTFTINAKTANGQAISGTITCNTFGPAVAEGGN